MKKYFLKAHHFTKTELAVEEVVIIIFVCILTTAALAAKAIMPIRAGIVQCGTRAELPQSCREDSRCCGLLQEVAGDEPAPRPAPHDAFEDPASAIDPDALIHDENSPDEIHVE